MMTEDMRQTLLLTVNRFLDEQMAEAADTIRDVERARAWLLSLNGKTTAAGKQE